MSETENQPSYILSPISVDANTDVPEWSDADVAESDPATIASLGTANAHPHCAADYGSEVSRISPSTANAMTNSSGSVQKVDLASMKATSLEGAGQTAEGSEYWKSHDSKPAAWVSPAPSVQVIAPDPQRLQVVILRLTIP